MSRGNGTGYIPDKSNLKSSTRALALTISSGLKKAWEEAKTMEQKLVELVGSPKQIAWAEDIRKNMISYLSALVRKYEAEDRPARAEKKS